jgi:pimeloyl-ACP methyl ester carboxylesterase
MTESKTSRAPATRLKKVAASGRRGWAWPAAGLAAGVALGSAAILNRGRAKRAERDNPPLGRFVTVDGVRLHYVERGEGPPLVLLHGNGTMIEDWIVSGLMEELAKSRRVIAFDRPGFGHSDRPRSRVWTPSAQAALLVQAIADLGIEKPLVAGHSFGALVALAIGAEHKEAVSGVALIGGYYFPSVRADVPFVAQPAIPVFGDVMRYTVSPLIGSAMMPRINRKIFSPARVTERWLSDFPFEMMLRPSQIRAEAAEAAIMIPAAAALAPGYADVALPVTIVAGDGDAIVDTEAQAERLQQTIPGSKLVIVKGAGHMVHHTAPEKVIEALRAM